MVPGHDAPTSYLPAERAGAQELAEEIRRVAHSPLVDALLVASGTALAVLDDARQIVALNAAYLDLLGVRDPAKVLGMRPGEAAGCAHAGDAPGGCGTAPACATCGAALAILAGSRGVVGDRECALRVAGPAGTDDRAVRVHVAPFELGGRRFLAFSLVDVTAERRRGAVHRVLLHDLANVACGVLNLATEIAAPGEVAPQLRGDLTDLADRLVSGVQLMRTLGDGEELPPVVHVAVPAGEVVRALATLAAHHPAAAGKRLEVAPPPEALTLFTDPLILEHVLANMAVNAFEATPIEGLVRVTVEDRDGEVAFRVWNAGEIPAAVRPRVFQRHFTTKGEGRGEGTFAMRFFGERCLGGRVTFTSRRGEGTTFEVAVPVRPAPLRARS